MVTLAAQNLNLTWIEISFGRLIVSFSVFVEPKT